MKSAALYSLASLALFGLAAAEEPKPTLLLQQPTASQTQVAFIYAGDLWITSRDGGSARRLTSHPGVESSPRFSPDGEWIAFTGHYQGNPDVYLIASEGVLDWLNEGDQ